MKVAIIQYSTYGHITTMARAVKEGVVESGLASAVDLFQVQETLSDEVLQLIHAPEKPSDIPVANKSTFEDYDAFLFGIPTRFGNLPAQWVELWGQTGGLWTQGALQGKPAGIFVSTGTPGGGQEVTVRHAITYLAHHGLPYISLGYAPVFPEMTNLEEVHGGSAWGAGTYAGADGSRQPTALEKRLAKVQGEEFAKSAIKFMKTNETEPAKEDSTVATTVPTGKDKSKSATTDPVATGEVTKDGEATTKDNATKEAVTKETVAKEARDKQSTKTTKPDEKSGCKCTIV